MSQGVQDNKLFVAFLDEVGGPEPECFVDGLPKDILPELANCKQHLTEAQYEILVALIREFPDIFYRQLCDFKICPPPSSLKIQNGNIRSMTSFLGVILAQESIARVKIRF